MTRIREEEEEYYERAFYNIF